MIQVSGLQYQYPNATALSFPDFVVEKGEHLLLLGNSGSGKTTLLHLLGGLLKVKAGSIRVGTADLATLSEPEMDRFRGRHYGFIFQRNHLIQALSVKNNLLMAPFLAGLPPDEHRAEHVLHQLNLGDKIHARVNQLSQGQAQRVAIARAILNKPDVILADEPTSALDDQNCERVAGLLLQIATENNATLIVATHDQRLKSKIQNRIQL
jgi:ABC-type lipoprotein export system ATPase subunit